MRPPVQNINGSGLVAAGLLAACAAMGEETSGDSAFGSEASGAGVSPNVVCQATASSSDAFPSFFLIGCLVGSLTLNAWLSFRRTRAPKTEEAEDGAEESEIAEQEPCVTEDAAPKNPVTFTGDGRTYIELMKRGKADLEDLLKAESYQIGSERLTKHFIAQVLMKTGGSARFCDKCGRGSDC